MGRKLSKSGKCPAWLAERQPRKTDRSFGKWLLRVYLKNHLERSFAEQLNLHYSVPEFQMCKTRSTKWLNNGLSARQTAANPRWPRLCKLLEKLSSENIHRETSSGDSPTEEHFEPSIFREERLIKRSLRIECQTRVRQQWQAGFACNSFAGV